MLLLFALRHLEIQVNQESLYQFYSTKALFFFHLNITYSLITVSLSDIIYTPTVFVI